MTIFRSSLLVFLLSISASAHANQPLPTNKQLTIGISQEFETLNPILKQMVASNYIYSMIGHPLVSIDADWKWRCFLCKTIPTLENGKARLFEEKGKKKIITEWELKENTAWGDGTPLTGNDVKLSWQIGLSPNVAVGLKSLYEIIENVIVDQKNPRKFTITFNKPNYDYFQLPTLYIVPSHIEGPIWEKAKNTNGLYEKTTEFAIHPSNPGLYSGPYVVKEIKLGSHVVLIPNPHYYGKKPSIQKIIFKLIPNTQTMEGNLLSGTIDMIAELGMTFDQAIGFEKRVVKSAEMSRRFSVQIRESTTYEHIDLNFRNPLMKDARVRRALVYAIDRQKLVDALFEGKQKVALHNVHPLDPYFSDDVAKYPYDAAKANALLEEAGWKLGSDKVRQKDGKKFVLTIMTTAENKTRELVQVFLQNEWKKIGIELRIKNEPARVFFGETIRKGTYPDMAMFAWSSSPDSPPKSMLYSKEIPTPANGYSGQNSGSYANPSLDETLDKIEIELNFDKRKTLMKKVQQIYAEEIPAIPLYYRSEVAVIPANLKGFRLTGHQFYSAMSVEYWNLQ